MQSLPERDFRHWRELAGERAQEMLADRAAAMEGMGDPEAGVRMAAMGILSRHWNSKRDMDFAEACERLAVEDADPACGSRRFSASGILTRARITFASRPFGAGCAR